MSTKIITAWVDGAVQEISVPNEEYIAPAISIEGKISAIITTVTLPMANWRGGASPYYQTLTSSLFTANSMVDLQPTPEQLAAWQDEGLAFSTVNDGGSVTVYCAGGLPDTDVIVQIKIQEVAVI